MILVLPVTCISCMYSYAGMTNPPLARRRQEFPSVSVAGLALLNQLLTYDPAKRASARAALRHAYFREQPLPREPGDMPTFPSAHDAPDAHPGWRSRRWAPACSSLHPAVCQGNQQSHSCLHAWRQAQQGSVHASFQHRACASSAQEGQAGMHTAGEAAVCGG